MRRAAFLGSASLIFVSCAALPACGQQDETQAVLTQCSNPAPRDVDSCLERARVLDETNPTKEVQALVAQLIQRQVRQPGQTPPDGQPDDDHPPDDAGVSSYDTTPPTPPPAEELQPLQPYQQPPDANAQSDAPPDMQGNPDDAGPPPDQGPPPPQDSNQNYQTLPPPR
jgi:hypothetical protein